MARDTSGMARELEAHTRRAQAFTGPEPKVGLDELLAAPPRLAGKDTIE